MLKTIFENKAIEIDIDADGMPFVKGKSKLENIEVVSPKYLKITKDNKLYHVLFEGIDFSEKQVLVRINGEKRSYKIKDKFDEKLEKLGMAQMGERKFNELKSPMPGLVLSLKVQPGDMVKKGDALIVLEAMKMENILKSPADVTIKEIKVQQGTAVEKNKVLITFE